jgi:hypothetical protein
MKRLLRGSVVLAVAVGFLSCSGDPTSGFREPEGITANPTIVFINVGETKPVLVSLDDDQGNQLGDDIEIAAVGPGITVTADTAFLHTNTGEPIKNQRRFQVTGTAIANSSFTLAAGGKTREIPVRVTPGTLSFGISNATPAWGDTITITAPVGALFTDTSEVTFAGGPPGDVVSISADRTQLVVVPGPNTSGAVTVSHTTVTYNPALDFTVTSVETVTSPVLTEVAGAFSSSTPPLGTPITLTLPAGIRVIPESAVAGFTIQGNNQLLRPANITVSADSGTITFIPAPNSDSTAIIPGIVPAPLPQFPQTLITTTKVTTTRFDSVATTFSDRAPDILEVVTVTAPAGFHFAPNATFTFPGGLGALVQSVAAGGASASIIPLPNSNGHPLVGNVIVDAAPQFLLALPSQDTLVVPPITPLAGTDAAATAPTITIPGPGGTTTINDAGPYAGPSECCFGGPTRLYKFVLSGSTTLTFNLDWFEGQDLGVYITTDPTLPAATINAADGASHPEILTLTLAAGTYYAAIPNFSTTNPNIFQLKVSRP